MTSVGNEASRVGKHADKVTENAVLGKRLEVVYHAELAVVEPPCTAVLYLAGYAALERVDNTFQ